MKALFGILALSLLSFTPAAHAIVNGTAVDANERIAKQSVLILFGRNMRCTGSVIAKNVILTAAHCAYMNPQSYDIAFTTELVNTWQGRAHTVARKVKDVKIHPDFGKRDALSDDIALFILERDVPENYEIAKLVPKPLDTSIGTKITPVGFGLQNPAGYPYPSEPIQMMKKELSITAVPADVCINPVTGMPFESNCDTFDFNYHRFFLVQKEGGICTGDSGGPVFLAPNTNPKIAAVVGATFGSGGTACADKGYVTRIDHALDWIKAEIAAASLPSN